MASRLLALSLYLCAGSAPAFANGSPLSQDNVKGRALDFVTHQVRPMAFSGDGAHLYVLNQPGARLAVFELPGLALVAEIPVSLGMVSVAERVSGQELWLVDAVQHSVVIIDPSTQTITDTIRTGAEPHGIVFTPDKSRAYVSCSADHRIDVIDALTKTVVKSIPVPAMNPRALEWLDGKLWITSFRSGNNTAPMGAATGNGANNIIEVRDLADFPGLTQLPDRDLLSITPQVDASDDEIDATVYTALGTMLLDVQARPGTTELWIANTEALNAVHRGERAFIEGQVVSNRVTILDVSSGVRQIIDLDELAPEGGECAQPTGVTFSRDGSLAFIAGYNTDRVVVLSVDGTGQVDWLGQIEILPGQSYPEGSGPRSLLVSPDGATMYIFSKIDNGLIALPLASLPGSGPFTLTAPLPVDIGFTPVAGRELRGRFLFVNAKFSKSQTSSCASCHVDATTDGLAWDLSKFLDPEGTDPGDLQFGIDVKGPLVTQNTLRLGEIAPYHWRGEKAGLIDFNGAFIDLLENEEDGETSDIGGSFQYISSYMRHLPIPANPRQELDRSLTDGQQRGEDLFRNALTFNGMTCADCHSLPLGTSGEHVAFKMGGSSKSGVVPQLRGIADKLAPPLNIGGRFGRRTELGAGLLHGGAISGLFGLLELEDPDNPGQPLFNLSPVDVQDMVAYLESFDTGLAPATTIQVTANLSNWNGSAREMLLLLIEQAEKGACDLVARRSPLPGPPAIVHRSLMYDTNTGEFVPAEQGGTPISPLALLFEASQGSPVTFMGVPGLSGLQVALDRDMDGLWDLDELAVGTDPEVSDHDDDGFPDGYEVLWGMDPTQPNSSSPDLQAPSLLAAPMVVYTTGTALKIEFETDEVVRVHVRVDGELVARLPFGLGFEHQFSYVIGELQPGRSYEVQLEILDPADNTATETFNWSTRPRVFSESVRVTAIRPELVTATPPARAVLHVTVHLGQGASVPVAGYKGRVSVYHRRDSDALVQMITPKMDRILSSENGRMLFATELPRATDLGGTGVLVITVQDILAPQGAAPYVEALDTIGTVEIPH